MTDITKAVMIVTAFVVMIATFVDTNIGLIVILLSMLLSPELEAGSTPGRAVVIRAEDLVLIMVSLTWLLKMALRKAPVVRPSPLNAPIGIYIAVLTISTLRGMVTGNVMPLKGTFYVLKLVEYFILYFIVLNHTTTDRQVKIFLLTLLLTATIVGVYGNTHIGRVERISAPFEGRGEPNTLGGYLLFIMSILGGIVLYRKQGRLPLLLLFLFLVPTFVFTLSRASYLGMVPALIAFVVLSRDKRVMNIVLILFVSFAFLVALGPPVLKQRVIGAFMPEQSQKLKSVAGVSLGPSPAARVTSWKVALTEQLPKKPVLGFGMTGAGFLDSQYFLALAETGFVGFMVFLWLMWRVWKAAFDTYRRVETPLYKGIALGYLSGFVGLLFQAIGTNTFIIIRIAEPFWFFTAIVVKLVDIETGKAKMEADSLALR